MANVPAARNVLKIVKYLAAQSSPSRATTIARDLDLPRSSTYHLIKVLQDEGFVVHFPEERSFSLTPLVSDIGSSYTRSYKLELLARPLAKKLITRVRIPAVAQVGVLRGNDVIYLAQERSTGAPGIVTQVGVSVPAHRTATGRAILSRLPAAQVRALYPSSASLIVGTELAPMSMRSFKHTLAVARERGWAQECEENAPELGSVSAAALDNGGHPVVAITLTFRVRGMTEETWNVLGEAVRISGEALGMRVRGKI
ncbi:MAG: IclR family transcriptional regulator [Microbacterium sp.]